MDSQRVCVIGAGPSGTAVLRAFKSTEEKGVEIPAVVCYEKQSEWGGLWNYTWQTGVNQFGEPVHNSQYCHLWSNGPKECLEFADYHFEEHFGKAIPSYPPREVLRDYIIGRVEKSGVKEWVQCNTVVRDCVFDEESKKFEVKVYNLVTGKTQVENFDYVFCCSGHFSTPNIPSFPGIETFPGRVLHAHDYRSAEQFKDKNILVIGTSYSAEDIASQCYKYGANQLYLSWRTAPMGFHWPDKFKTVPLLKNVSGRICTFLDDQQAEIDDIILCTGYQHYFPFMDTNLRLQTANRLWCDSLHEGIVWPSNHRLFYIGMQDQWFTFNMFDAQAWYARDVVLGRIKLPDKDTMSKEWYEWRANEEALEATDEANIRFQADYVQHLVGMTDYPNFNIEGVVQCFLEWERNKHTNIMTFRDKPHKSLMTGTMAPVHHTPWLKAFDDSLECYVDGKAPSKSTNQH
mmetsp:Transcript_26796/g.39645  ORF Transcript_26796/g.39645 Transcript_26796/m.39645 type:complete len:459 (+) Transcript_26796:192-1568(+)|eukprot:CAMPEP_0194215466 /NCGR_PEP_ID=MMETSP0156-20130528/17285_1 /TAXON_ID=33649 /ORGANISM="Thalassionema nitzschioides, Strain L26-B" /LENGTH=458 /DNA_ID=CAMNT_0038943985 /DNA_START=184 /DNA_END=1560 /DNA_ORIENTATION=-